MSRADKLIDELRRHSVNDGGRRCFVRVNGLLYRLTGAAKRVGTHIVLQVEPTGMRPMQSAVDEQIAAMGGPSQ